MAETPKQPAFAIIALIAALAALALSAATAWWASRPLTTVAAEGAVSPVAEAANTSENSSSEKAAGEAVDDAAKLQALTDELRQEQASRLELQRQVAGLEEQLTGHTETLESLRRQLDAATVIDQAGSATGFATGASEAAQQAHQAAQGDTARDSFANAFGRRNRTAEQRIASLQQAGVDEGRAADLVQRIDRNQLAELDLRDEAARGGWLDSDEFDQRLDQLEDNAPDLRTELGDQAYDRYLFANGTPNRVVISTVIDGSAANAAGIEVRDVILSYAGQRLFTVQELQQATRAGVRGESVPVLLRRGPDNINLTVSRGPLGVTLTRDLQEPDS